MGSDADLFRAMFTGTNDAVIELDRNHRIVRVNPGFERMLGFAPEHVLGRPIEELLVPNAPHRGSTEPRLDGSVTPFLLLFRAVDGRHVDGESVTAPLDGDAGEEGFVLIVRDATERRRHEMLQAILLLVATATDSQLDDALVSSLIFAMELTGASGATLMALDGHVLASVGRTGTGASLPCVAAGTTIAMLSLPGANAETDPNQLDLLTTALAQRLRDRSSDLTVSLTETALEHQP